MDPVLPSSPTEAAPAASNVSAGTSTPGLDLREGVVLFERFTLVRPLGQGRCSITWLAEDDRFRSDVALKIFYAGEGQDSDRTRLVWHSLLRQLRILNHPNICLPLEFFLEEPWGAIDSDFAEGETLAAILQSAPSRKMPFAVAAPLLLQIGRALLAAHGQAGVVHGNLNACNVIVDQASQRVRVTDFGFFPPPATPGNGSDGESDSKSGTLAPERQQGGGPSFEDDIYAFGALCLRTLTGLRPQQDAEGNREALRGVAALPADWQQQITAALAPLPQRPHSMQALLSLIKSTAKSEPRPLPPVQRKSSANQPTGGKAQKAWMILGGLLFVAALYILITQHLQDTRILQIDRLREEALEKQRGDPEKDRLREMEKRLGISPFATNEPDQPAAASGSPSPGAANGGTPPVQVINSQAQELLTEGLANQKEGDQQAALNNYELATVLQENWPPLLEARASALNALDRPDEALKGYDRVLVLEPGRPASLLARGKIYASRNQTDLARADFQAALQSMPDFPGAQEALDNLH